MRRFFASQQSFSGDKVVLDEGETRHLRDVLRLDNGDLVNVFDGEGGEFECQIVAIRKRDANLAIVRSVEPTARESELDLTVCAAILKGDKTDFVIQKSVELGVNRFVPILTSRTDVKPNDPLKRVERWRRIALEAAKQCGRARLMSIGEIESFDDMVRSGSNRHLSDNILMFFSERDGGKLPLESKPKSITAFLGPEGGWDDSEIELANEFGASVVTLHGRIMKADTAAIAISAILQHHFGDLN